MLRWAYLGSVLDVESDLGLAALAKAVVGGAGVLAGVLARHLAEGVREGGGDEPPVPRPPHPAHARLCVHVALQCHRPFALHSDHRLGANLHAREV